MSKRDAYQSLVKKTHTSCPDLHRSHMTAYGIRDRQNDTYRSDFISRVDLEGAESELTWCDRNWNRYDQRDSHIHSGQWSGGDGKEDFPDQKG